MRGRTWKWCVGLVFVTACGGTGRGETNGEALATISSHGVTRAILDSAVAFEARGGLFVAASSERIGTRVSASPRLFDAVRIETRTDTWLEVSPLDVRDKEARVAGKSLVFDDAATSTDIVDVLTRQGFEELRVLRDRSAPRTMRYRLRVNGGSALRVGEDGRVEVVDENGFVALVSPRPFAVDAKHTRRELAVTLHGDLLELSLDDEGLEYPIVVDPAWTTVASMLTPRTGAAAVQLSTGKVLVAGGSSSGGPVKSTELYDVATNTWSAAGGLTVAATRPILQALAGGKAMLFDVSPPGSPPASTAGATPNSIQLFDGASWTLLSGSIPLNAGLYVFDDARILRLGGKGSDGKDLSDASLYDPTTASWVAAGSVSSAPDSYVDRVAIAFTPLPTGKLLAFYSTFTPTEGTAASIFDPAAKTWTTAVVHAGRMRAASRITLPSGKVLLTGGTAGDDGYSEPAGVSVASKLTTTAIRFNVTTNAWEEAGSLHCPRANHVSWLAADGHVHVQGGTSGSYADPVKGTVSCNEESYDETTNAWTIVESTTAPPFASTCDDPLFGCEAKPLSTGLYAVGHEAVMRMSPRGFRAFDTFSAHASAVAPLTGGRVLVADATVQIWSELPSGSTCDNAFDCATGHCTTDLHALPVVSTCGATDTICSTDKQCGDQLCVRSAASDPTGQCQPGCRVDVQCGAQVCVFGAASDPIGQCQLGPTCSAATDCATGLACESGRCSPRCTSDFGCRGSETCVADVRSLSRAGTACSSVPAPLCDVACPKRSDGLPQVCSAGHCALAPTCASAADCAPGSACETFTVGSSTSKHCSDTCSPDVVTSTGTTTTCHTGERCAYAPLSKCGVEVAWKTTGAWTGWGACVGCGLEQDACGKDAICSAWLACLNACPSGDDGMCGNGCLSKYDPSGSGAVVLEAFATCVNWKCDSALPWLASVDAGTPDATSESGLPDSSSEAASSDSDSSSEAASSDATAMDSAVAEDVATETASDDATSGDTASSVDAIMSSDTPPTYDGGSGAPTVGGSVQACKADSECSTGHCVEGVCCDTACTDKCHSCALATSPGKCTPEPAGVDLKAECGPALSCVGTCNGGGGCIGAGPGTMCRAPKCTSRSKGIGLTRCVAPGQACASEAESTPFDCDAYACEPALGACYTSCSSSTQCADGFTCDTSSQHCVAAPPPADESSGCSYTNVGRTNRDAAWLGLAALAFVSLRARGARRRPSP